MKVTRKMWRVLIALLCVGLGAACYLTSLPEGLDRHTNEPELDRRPKQRSTGWIGLSGRTSNEPIVTTNSLGMSFVWVPPGRFMMGCSPTDPIGYHKNDTPRHQETIEKGFWLGQFEVRRRDWFAINGVTDLYEIDLDLPIYGVTWDQAVDFCRKLSDVDGHQYRLPSEVEWEYACKAGSDGQRYGPLDEIARMKRNTPPSLVWPVGTRKPNEFGLYDMLGNVAEWCQDDFHSYDKGAGGDGGLRWSVLAKTKVIRGGFMGDKRLFFRAAARFWLDRDGGKKRYTLTYPVYRALGLRVVMTAPGPTRPQR